MNFENLILNKIAIKENGTIDLFQQKAHCVQFYFKVSIKLLFILCFFLSFSIYVFADYYESETEYMIRVEQENQEMNRIFNEKEKYCKKSSIDELEAYCFDMKSDGIKTGGIFGNFNEVQDCFNKLDEMLNGYSKCFNMCDHYAVKSKGWIDCLGEEYKIKTTILSDYYKYKDYKSGVECKAACLDEEDANCSKSYPSNYDNNYINSAELYDCMEKTGDYCQKKCFKDSSNLSNDYLVFIDEEDLNTDGNKEDEYWHNIKKIDLSDLDYLKNFLDAFFNSIFDFNSSPFCVGNTPNNSKLCADDDNEVAFYTEKTLVEFCSEPRGSQPKCEYICKYGYIFNNEFCERKYITHSIIDWFIRLFNYTRFS